jgi:type IV secretion system protein VirD4
MSVTSVVALMALAAVAWAFYRFDGRSTVVHSQGPVAQRRPLGDQRSSSQRYFAPRSRREPSMRVRGDGDSRGARWARRRDLGDLVVGAPTPGRLVLGSVGGRLVAAERRHSVLVVGPTQSGKTTGLAIPALLEWEGPVVAASVKTDLVRDTFEWRERKGKVWVYDPTRSTGLVTAPWSPLTGSRSWTGARRMAASLSDVAKVSAGMLSEGDFWYATAAKLLAPLLHAAALSGRSMADVVRWVDEQEVTEVEDALVEGGATDALRAAEATWRRDGRQRSSVYTTTEMVIEAFADPTVAASTVIPGTGEKAEVVDPDELLRGDNTLYLCAPAQDQKRLRPLFSTLVSEVITAAYMRSSISGEPIDPPLLVLVDEASNVAPLAELDVLASTAAGQGVQLVTVWQDLAQISSRYGPRAGSVVNNHRAKLFLSGIADPATLDHASSLIGDAEHRVLSTTTSGSGPTSTTDAPHLRRLLPADTLRRISPGSGVLIYGHLPPVRLRLRSWKEDSGLSSRVSGPTRVPRPHRTGRR